jgi:hypothetical protein
MLREIKRTLSATGMEAWSVDSPHHQQPQRWKFPYPNAHLIRELRGSYWLTNLSRRLLLFDTRIIIPRLSRHSARCMLLRNASLDKLFVGQNERRSYTRQPATAHVA